jgi:uncharacterized membrane protein YheB (UPF0754 family)
VDILGAQSSLYLNFFLKNIFPPLFYAFHGWIATKMAIWALFHPYEPWYVPGTKWQIPCTPGIFPKRRAKLAQAVAATVTDTLLTTQDIKLQAETLVTEQNLYLAIDAFVDSVLKEFRDTTKLHRLAQDVAELSPTLLSHLVTSIVDGVEKGQEQRIANVVEKIFDQIILSTHISLPQAKVISQKLLESVLTPAKIREVLIAVLSVQNIKAVDESIQAHASGPYKLLARLIGVKRLCYEWRNFFERHPEEAQQVISDLVGRFGLEDQLAQQIASFDLRSMPLNSIAQLKSTLVSFVKTFMLEHRQDILEMVEKIDNEAMGTVRAAIVQFNPDSIPHYWLQRCKKDLALFFYAYLERELGALLEKAIPALGMYGLIARKIDLFSPQELEKLINRLCEQELRWLAWLGGFIGGWLGLVQVCVNYVIH